MIGWFSPVFEPTTMNTPPAKSEVVFKRYNGQGYVLKSVWEEGSSEGVQTILTEAERHHD